MTGADARPTGAAASPAEAWELRVQAARATARDKDELVTVEVDASGEVLGLTLEPKAMRLPREDLAAAIARAVNDAGKAARAELGAAPPAAPLDLTTMQRTLTELGLDAQRRLGDFAEVARVLTDRLGRG